MSPDSARKMLEIEQIINTHIAPLFRETAAITLLIRLPEDDGAAVMLSTDADYPALVEAITRMTNTPNQRDLVVQAGEH